MGAPERIQPAIIGETRSCPATAMALTSTSQPNRLTTCESRSLSSPTETRETVDASAKSATPRPLADGVRTCMHAEARGVHRKEWTWGDDREIMRPLADKRAHRLKDEGEVLVGGDAAAEDGQLHHE